MYLEITERQLNVNVYRFLNMVDEVTAICLQNGYIVKFNLSEVDYHFIEDRELLKEYLKVAKRMYNRQQGALYLFYGETDMPNICFIESKNYSDYKTYAEFEESVKEIFKNNNI